MKRSAGFTLIELVIIIVILGILAITAAPKFLNLQGDARKSTLDGVKAAMESSASMIYSKSVIRGVEGIESSSVSAGTSTVSTAYGYPAGTAAGIGATLDLSPTDWASGASGTSWVVWPLSGGVSASCNVTYAPTTTSGARPTATVNFSGC